MGRSFSFSRAFWPLALALLAGCANMEWSKPGADASAVSRDLEACRGVALSRSGPALSPVGSSDAATDRGSTRGMPSSTMDSNERFVAEHAEVQRCMQKRGYTLQRQD